MIRSKLLKLRLDHGLTQGDIAKELGMTRAGYSYIERGKRNISYSMAFKIAKVFGKNPDDIFLESELTKKE